MRIAVFTNKFPARVSTFFARDIAALLDSGVEIEIFTLYPVEEQRWDCVPAALKERLAGLKIHQPRSRTLLANSARMLAFRPGTMMGWYVPGAAISARYGVGQIAKTVYAVAHGSSCALACRHSFDHIVAYWGNYAATSALVFRETTNRTTPFSMFLHAGIDLYRDQILLQRKLRAARNIIVVCDFNRRFLKLKYPALYREIEHKIHLHHLGLELNEYAYTIPRPAPDHLVAVGYFCKAKGFDVLVRAVAQLRSRGIAVRLEFAGEGPELSSCRRLAERLRMTDCIRFLGWLSPDLTRQKIAEASILIHPSVGLGDAVPTVIKEAMSLGTAVIASNVAGIPELLDEGRCGLLVEPRKPEALASAIEEVVLNPGLRARFVERARRRAEQLFDTGLNGQELATVLAGKPATVMVAPAMANR